MKKPKGFKADIHVRFRDLDTLGHVNNSDYPTYFEDARDIFLQAHNVDFYDPEIFFILAHISCDYKIPIAYKTRVSIYIECLEIGNKSFRLGYTVANRDDSEIVYATGESVQVCFDPKANKAIPVSEKLKKLLRETLQ